MQENMIESWRLVLPSQGIIEVSKLSKYLGCSTQSLKDNLKKKNIPVLKLSQKWLVRLEDLKDGV